MRYIITIGLNQYESTSRDAKKHLRDKGGNECTVRTKNGKLVSMAKRDCNDKIYSCYVGE